MVKKQKFGDFFGRKFVDGKVQSDQKKPVSFFGAPAAEHDHPRQAKTFFATSEQAQAEREERQREREQKAQDKQQAKRHKENQARLAQEEKQKQKQARIDAKLAAQKRKQEEAKLRQQAQEEAKAKRAYIKKQERCIADMKRQDRAAARKGQERGGWFYSIEDRERDLEHFKKHGTTERPLEINHNKAGRIKEIYQLIEL